MSPGLRFMVGSVGWTGHVFPALALAQALRARGHHVFVETFERWRETVEQLESRFIPAREHIAFPGIHGGGGGPTLAESAREAAAVLRGLRPDVVVSDVWTIAPAIAAELAGLKRATLIPHPYPVREPGLPFYTLGLAPPRTSLGASAWRALWPVVGTRLPNTRLRSVRAALNRTRAELGLPARADYDGQISDELALVATFPQLEYPRRWPRHVHVTGPMPFELPYPEVEPPPGDHPLVLVAPSTERDPELRLVRTAVSALADEPVRVIATTNRLKSAWDGPVPANARVTDWISYSQTMPQAALVVCHGGHGTIARALSEGVPVLVCPPAGDMAENGARVRWSGTGMMLPNRLLGRASLRWAVRALLADPAFATRARDVSAWSEGNDGASVGAVLLERLARAYR